MNPSLEKTMERMDARIQENDGLREIALKESREIIRRSASLIMACHRGEEPGSLEGQGSDIWFMVMDLCEKLTEYPSVLYSGFVENAQAEAVEALVVFQLRKNAGSTEPFDFPSPEELGVRDNAYLKGLGDVLGELRRFILEALRQGQDGDARWYYDRMEEVYSCLMTLGYSRATSDLRKKLDTGRILLERTLGELVHMERMGSLERKLENEG